MLSAILFGVHKWRSEQITSKFSDSLPLVGVQILVLAVLSSFFCLPNLLEWVQGGGGDLWAATMELPWPQLVFMGLATTSLTLWIEMESLKVSWWLGDIGFESVLGFWGTWGGRCLGSACFGPRLRALLGGFEGACGTGRYCLH